MSPLELKVDDNTHRYLNHYGRIFKRTRNDATGDYGIHEQHFTDKRLQTLKQVYGPNGDTSNISSSFLLRFPDAQKHNLNSSLKGELLSVFKSYDNTSVLSTYEVDTSQRQNGLNLYLNVSWTKDDVNAETKSNTLINDFSTILASMSSFLTPPFNNVELNASLQPITMDGFVTPTLHSIVSTYNEGTNDTDIVVKTVGLYDHIGVKINNEGDNEYRRLKNIGENSINIASINPLNDVIIATLFDGDYKKLYTLIQSPVSYIQATQGTAGDLYNENVEGSITLDLNYNDFITNNQEDFISTMNSATGGYTVIINVYAGSAVVEYNIILSVTKTLQEINEVVAKLSDDIEIQNIINTSATMNGVTASKTVNTTVKRTNQVLTKTSAILSVRYDAVNTKVVFNTVGSYTYIMYKATGQATYLQTTSKSVDLPVGFVDQVDAKLVNVSGGNITTEKTYTVDVVSPMIVLNGDTEITLNVGDTYVEQGATVTDNSGESLTAVITGNVDTNIGGTYIITYTATDSSGNSTSVNRIVNIVSPLIDMVEGNFSTSSQALPTYPLPQFVNNEIIMNRYNAIGYYASTTLTDYNQPFRVIYKMQHTYIGDRYIEFGFAKTTNGVGQVSCLYTIILEQSPRQFGLTLLNSSSSTIPLTFYALNVDRYAVVTYNGGNTTNFGLYDETGTAIWTTTFNTDISWGAVLVHPVVLYINANEALVKGIYTANDPTADIVNSFN